MKSHSGAIWNIAGTSNGCLPAVMLVLLLAAAFVAYVWLAIWRAEPRGKPEIRQEYWKKVPDGVAPERDKDCGTLTSLSELESFQRKYKFKLEHVDFSQEELQYAFHRRIVLADLYPENYIVFGILKKDPHALGRCHFVKTKIMHLRFVRFVYEEELSPQELELYREKHLK